MNALAVALTVVLTVPQMSGCATPDQKPRHLPDLVDAALASTASTAPRDEPSSLVVKPADLGRSTDPVISTPAAESPIPKAPPTVALPPVPPSPSPTLPHSPPSLARPATKAVAPLAVPARSAPPLDLKSLEARLKATPGIGLFTKLALKNQIDDLLAQFRAHYSGQRTSTLAELRQAYDRLLLKVLALLQDSDPPLARAIASSRESIWDILSNPARFAAV